MSRAGWIFAAAVVIIAVVAPFVASASPDGLERVAADLGFEGRASAPTAAPMADYALPAAGPLSGPLAGLVGVVAVGGLALGAGALLKRRA